MSRQPGERVPQLLLERLALGELPPEDRDALESRLEPEDRERLDAIARSNEEILAAHPPAVVAAGIERRLEAQRRRRRLLWIAAPVAAAAVVVLLMLVLPLLSAPPPSGRVGPTRPKGEPMIFVFRKQDRRAEELQPGSTVSTGDLLQITYTASGARHGVILSVDGRGKLTLHFPDAPDRSTALAPGGPHALPFSYELDDAPEFERFFFVTSRTPIDIRNVMSRARKTLTAHPDLELRLPGLKIKELSLKKGGRR